MHLLVLPTGALDCLITAPALYLKAFPPKAQWLTTLLLPLPLLLLPLLLLLLLLPLCGTLYTLLDSPGECLKQLALVVQGRPLTAMPVVLLKHNMPILLCRFDFTLLHTSPAHVLKPFPAATFYC
jgi:hypothetical protein